MEQIFVSGDFVKHLLTNEKCLVLKKGKEQYLIRTNDYKEVWVYGSEITKD